MNSYDRFTCGHSIYSTLTQLYRYSSYAQSKFTELKNKDHKAYLNEFCTISMNGPRGSGWDTGLKLFVQNEIVNDTTKEFYSESHRDAIIVCTNKNMADLFCNNCAKDNYGHQQDLYNFTNNAHARICVTWLGSNSFLGIDTNKVIFNNYTLMKKNSLHKKKLKQVKQALFPVLCSHEKRFLFEIS